MILERIIAIAFFILILLTQAKSHGAEGRTWVNVGPVAGGGIFPDSAFNRYVGQWTGPHRRRLSTKARNAQHSTRSTDNYMEEKVRINTCSNQPFQFQFLDTGEEIPQKKQATGVIAQDQTEKKEVNPTLGDFFFHEKGIGQRSDFSRRTYTPTEIQNVTPEELAQEEAQRRRANAGAKAATTAVDAIGQILPTNKGGAISGAAGEVISAVSDKLGDKTEELPPQAEKPTEIPQTGKTESRNVEPQEDKPSVPEEPKKKEDKSGLRMNPDYIGQFENIDPESLTKPPKKGPTPKPNLEGPVRIKVGPAPARKDAILEREMDNAGDIKEKQKYLEMKRLERIW